jgi:hypothetical protein
METQMLRIQSAAQDREVASCPASSHGRHASDFRAKKV